MKNLIIAGLVIALVGGGVGFYLYNKPHKSLSSIQVKYNLSAATLIDDYNLNENESDTKYLDQILEIEGEIQSIEREGETINVVLGNSNEISTVICQMENGKYQIDDFKLGELIKIKGICTGMLMDVVLVQCVKSN